MVNKTADIAQESEDDLFVVILVALRGYLEENHKPFSVSKDVLHGLFEGAVADDLRPTLSLRHTDDNRLEITVDLEKHDD